MRENFQVRAPVKDRAAEKQPRRERARERKKPFADSIPFHLVRFWERISFGDNHIIYQPGVERSVLCQQHYSSSCAATERFVIEYCSTTLCVLQRRLKIHSVNFIHNFESHTQYIQQLGEPNTAFLWSNIELWTIYDHPIDPFWFGCWISACCRYSCFFFVACFACFVSSVLRDFCAINLVPRDIQFYLF